MDKETITLFAHYNQVANEAMNDVIKTLSTEEWEKNLGGYFGSVHGVCSHLYICDFNWLKRYAQFRGFSVFDESFFTRAPYSYDELIFNTMDEYLESRPELDEWFIRFAHELNSKDIEGVLSFTASGGTVRTWTLGKFIMQCLNHGTFTRGMISLYLEMLGKDNDFGSLIRVLKRT